MPWTQVAADVKDAVAANVVRPAGLGKRSCAAVAQVLIRCGEHPEPLRLGAKGTGAVADEDPCESCSSRPTG